MRTITFDLAELRAMQPLPYSRGCDFCAEGAPSFRYPAHDVGLGAIAYGEFIVHCGSRGEWRACTDCSELIEAGDWPSLARRSLKSLRLDLSRAGPGVRVRLLAALHASHERFQSARSGPREAA
jgi:hypothetical protein